MSATPPPALGSKWGSLSKFLMATIYPVDASGKRVDGSPSVVSPVMESSLEISANWQSPFEQSGLESKAPNIMAMLQNGTFESWSETLLGKGSDAEGASWKARLSKEITDFSKEAQGRSGMTKLNSTQVFTGAAPIKISLTLQFRAFDDPVAEVRAPVDQLAQWSLARSLAPNGSLVTALIRFKQGEGFLKTLLPSQAPQMVGLAFDGCTFSPMVIENLSRPLAVPRGATGDPLHVTVQISLATLTALDANDWRLARQGLPTQLFNN